jgi:hypothetical protein
VQCKLAWLKFQLQLVASGGTTYCRSAARLVAHAASRNSQKKYISKLRKTKAQLCGACLSIVANGSIDFATILDYGNFELSAQIIKIKPPPPPAAFR